MWSPWRKVDEPMMNRFDVERAVAEQAELLRADGADLHLVDADLAAARLSLRLDLDGVACVDCVMPPQRLRDLVQGGIGRSLRSEIDVEIDDPRLRSVA